MVNYMLCYIYYTYLPYMYSTYFQYVARYYRLVLD